HIADVPASVVLETVDIPMEVLHDSFIHRPGHDLFYRIKASVMSSSPHCELIQPLKDIHWETDQAVYCAYDTLGIILSNMGHNTNTEWSLNGSTINPVSTVKDTFFLAGPYDPDDEIQLTIRRLG